MFDDRTKIQRTTQYVEYGVRTGIRKQIIEIKRNTMITKSSSSMIFFYTEEKIHTVINYNLRTYIHFRSKVQSPNANLICIQFIHNGCRFLPDNDCKRATIN